MNALGLVVLAVGVIVTIEAVKLMRGYSPAPAHAGGGGSGNMPHTADSSQYPGGSAYPWLGDAVSWAQSQGMDPLSVVALIMGESGGQGKAYNAGDPYGGSYGLLQINGIHFPQVDPNRVNDLPYILGQTFEGPQLSSTYRQLTNGGPTFGADPRSFLYHWWPVAQVSVQPTWKQVDDALAQARAALGQA